MISGAQSMIKASNISSCCVRYECKRSNINGRTWHMTSVRAEGEHGPVIFRSRVFQIVFHLVRFGPVQSVTGSPLRPMSGLRFGPLAVQFKTSPEPFETV